MKTLKLILLFCFYMMRSFAQEAEMTVEYITTQDGLANNEISVIIKDASGFMWFGTNDGLSRYDGYKITNFKPDNEFLFVLDILQTDDGLLWCTSTNGLYCFDPVLEKFVIALKYESNNSKGLPIRRVTGISKGLDNTLWVTTSNGLCHLSNISKDKLDSETIHIKTYNKTNSSIPSNLLTTIVKDENDILWIGSSDQFLMTYNLKSEVFTKIPIHVRSKEKGNITNINSIYNKGNSLWIATMGGGIVRLEKSTLTHQTIERDLESDFSISHNDVYSIELDNWGNLWAGTWNGIDRIHAVNHTLKYTSIDNYNWDHPFFNEKLENRIRTLYWDKAGVMWVGTFGGGIVKITTSNSNYNRYKFDSRFEVNSFIEDNEGYLWVSMYHGGIKKSDQKIGTTVNYTFKDFKKENISTGLKSNIVLCSVKDAEGNLWFGTDQSSIYRTNKERVSFSEIKIQPKNAPNWKGIIKDICIDSKGNFWIGTDNGLVFCNKQQDDFLLIQSSSNKKHTLNDNYIKKIFEDSKRHIWIGTNDGLNKLIYQQNNTFRFNSFNDIFIPSETLYNKEVWSIFEDVDQQLWIGYRGGFGMYDVETGEIKIYNTRDGLPNNFVSCITEDNSGNLWLGTNSGISKFNKKEIVFENYYIANNNRTAYKDSYGNLYFGNNNGFLSFHPDNIKKNEIAPVVVITDLKINNSSININEDVNEQIILKQSLQHTKHITLNHLNHNFALEFVGLSFSFQGFNNYAYKLEGYRDEWTQVHSRNRLVTFKNLKPGDYTFHVKGSNNDGVWNNKPTSLSITIMPAWWNTWWARSIFFILVLTTLGTVYQIRIKSIYKEQNQAAEKLSLEHHLDIAKLEKIKEKELSELKSKFFTNLSHEIRTPLTLIISPLRDLLNSQDLSGKLKKQLKPIDTNANKLLKLINQILDFRKIETHKMTLQISESNINSFAKQIFNTFKSIATSNDIKYKFDDEKTPFKMWFDHKNIEIVINNLLSNAFKFTPKGGDISLKIRKVKVEGAAYCSITVLDSGRGITQEHQEHLFERFYQGSNAKTTQYAGTGIGLSMAKEIIELHQGKITVTSSVGKGSKFEALIPINKNQYPQNSIISLKIKEELTPITNITEEIEIEDKSDKLRLAKTIKKETLLIVEDTPDILNYIKNIFQDEYNILEAVNGQEGLEMTRKQLPDLIISDIMMPVMDGIALCKTLKSSVKTSYIPMILLTAKASDISKIEGLEIGADDYIIKPFDSTILKAKVNSFIINRKKLKEFFSKKITLEPSNLELETHEEKFLKTAIDFIENNLMNPKFNVLLLAENLNMSQATLYRKVKTFTNLSISQFIRSIRLKRAAQLLQLNEYSISEVTDMVGFSDTGYFRKCFMGQFGVNPFKYSKQVSAKT